MDVSEYSPSLRKILHSSVQRNQLSNPLTRQLFKTFSSSTIADLHKRSAIAQHSSNYILTWRYRSADGYRRRFNRPSTGRIHGVAAVSTCSGYPPENVVHPSRFDHHDTHHRSRPQQVGYYTVSRGCHAVTSLCPQWDPTTQIPSRYWNQEHGMVQSSFFPQLQGKHKSFWRNSSVVAERWLRTIPLWHILSR